MKKNYLYLVIAIAIIGFIWFWQNQQKNDQQSTLVDQDFQEEQVPERVITKTSFSILAPAGWAEIVPPANASLLIVNTSEKFTDPILEKLNFKTYYALINKSLEGKDMPAFITETNAQLKITYPLMKVEALSTRKVAGQDVQIYGSEVTERGARFKMMLAFFKGKNNDAWTISFNTGQDNWEKYRLVINGVIDSFKLN